jgi:hypothetical protein
MEATNPNTPNISTPSIGGIDRARSLKTGFVVVTVLVVLAFGAITASNVHQAVGQLFGGSHAQRWSQPTRIQFETTCSLGNGDLNTLDPATAHATDNACHCLTNELQSRGVTEADIVDLMDGARHADKLEGVVNKAGVACGFAAS